MPVRLAARPVALYRIGRSPDPLAFPPLAVSGHGRYDDPQRRRCVLYAAVERRAIFMETIDSFRPDLSALADRDSLLLPNVTGDIEPLSATIPAHYFQRRIVRFGLDANQRWLDVRSPATHAVLRDVLGAKFKRMGIGSRFVLGDLLASNHAITRMVAGWAIDNDYDGIAYASCHDPLLTCWAIFEGAALTPLEKPNRIDPNDRDLVAVANLWKLKIPLLDQ